MTDEVWSETLESWIADAKRERENAHARKVALRKRLTAEHKEARRVGKTYAHAWRGKR